MPNISLLDSLGRDPRYVLIIILETKTMNTFWAFPETIVIKILQFWVYFVANIGKMVIEIILRNVTSNICECLFLPGTSRLISDHIF